VFAYDRGGTRTFTAHPFLREYFRKLLGVPSADVHEVVRTKLAPSLAARPAKPPTEQAVLDRYEELIEHTRLAGKTAEAFELFAFGLGGYDHLGRVLGEYARGRRILAAFAPDGDPERAALDLPPRQRSQLVDVWGMFSREVGELVLAWRCTALAERLYLESGGSPKGLSGILRNAINIAEGQGDLPRARGLAVRALQAADESMDSFQRKSSHATLGRIHHRLGDVVEARARFATATTIQGSALRSIFGIGEARHLLELGDRRGARLHAEANLARSSKGGWNDIVANCHAVLGQAALPDDLAAARIHLASVRDWTAKSGDLWLVLESHLIAGEIARYSDDLQGAITEATTGLNLADGCGFGLLAIRLLVVLARSHLAVPDHRAALRYAREALDRSQHADCRYAWGEADALHLCGLAHRGLGEIELATRRLEMAVVVRQRIEHPDLEESRRALAALQRV
jgi:tetratricopeptide (TPR) repeat protein